MGRLQYVSVSIPRALVNRIDKVVDDDKLGYGSRPEFVKDAVRRLLMEIDR